MLKLSILTMFIVLASIAQGVTRVGMVFDRGGKDDHSFNSSAFKGLEEARAQFKLETKYVETADDNAFEPMLRGLARKGYDLVIGVGFSQADAIKKVAGEFPKTKFALVDGLVESPNIRSLSFAAYEGSFLVGAIAAMTSKSGIVGFIGGMDIPIMRRFADGFAAGVHHINPKAKVINSYIGITAEVWNNPPKAKELALSQFQEGADIIFGAAGASGNGIFDAAEEQKKLAIGVDRNQNGIKPGFILTSMLKRVDSAILQTCTDVVNGKFTAGIVEYGLRNAGVDYAVDENNAKILLPNVKAKAEQLKVAISSGKLKISG